MWEHVLIRLLHMGTSNKQIMIIVYGFAESGWFKSFFITTLTWGTHEKLGYKQSQVKNMCSVGIFPEI